MYEAVNLGGDTDSTASIIAAMAAIQGIEEKDVPNDFGEVMRLDELRRISWSFAQSIKVARHLAD